MELKGQQRVMKTVSLILYCRWQLSLSKVRGWVLFAVLLGGSIYCMNKITETKIVRGQKDVRSHISLDSTKSQQKKNPLETVNKVRPRHTQVTQLLRETTLKISNHVVSFCCSATNTRLCGLSQAVVFFRHGHLWKIGGRLQLSQKHTTASDSVNTFICASLQLLVLSVACRLVGERRRRLLIGIELHILIFHPLATWVLYPPVTFQLEVVFKLSPSLGCNGRCVLRHGRL